jgi:hypothetical protein
MEDSAQAPKFAPFFGMVSTPGSICLGRLLMLSQAGVAFAMIPGCTHALPSVPGQADDHTQVLEQHTARPNRALGLSALALSSQKSS